jgi:hypothetical protein
VVTAAAHVRGVPTTRELDTLFLNYTGEFGSSKEGPTAHPLYPSKIGCSISSSFKINAWSHFAVWHIPYQTIVPQISCVEGVSGAYCGVVSACYPHKRGIEWPFNTLWSKMWDAV